MLCLIVAEQKGTGDTLPKANLVLNYMCYFVTINRYLPPI